jgi:hypothetical protein
MAMIGCNSAVAEVGAHHHEVHGPVAFAAWLGVHLALLTGGPGINWSDDEEEIAVPPDLESPAREAS